MKIKKKRRKSETQIIAIQFTVKRKTEIKKQYINNYFIYTLKKKCIHKDKKKDRWHRNKNITPVIVASCLILIIKIQIFYEILKVETGPDLLCYFVFHAKYFDVHVLPSHSVIDV